MDFIDIITINTWKGEGDYRNRIRHLAAALKTLNPDVILCQECFRCDDKNADSLAQLAIAMGMAYDYVPARKKKRYFEGEWVLSESGLGLLTKYKILGSQSFQLPALQNDEERKIQQVQLQTPNGWNFSVFNVHLTHIESPENHRLQQIEYLASLLQERKGLPFFVGGDFNLLPSSFEIATLKDKANLKDCSEDFFSAQNRYSLTEAYEKGEKICVDYIFCPLGLVDEKRFNVREATVVLDKKDLLGGNYPSDHFGIHITVEITD